MVLKATVGVPDSKIFLLLSASTLVSVLLPAFCALIGAVNGEGGALSVKSDILSRTRSVIIYMCLQTWKKVRTI